MSPIHRARVRISPATRSGTVAVFSALLLASVASGFASGCASSTLAPELDAPPKQPVPVAETNDSERVAVRKASVMLEPVYFDTNEAMLRIDARDSLKSYVESIIDHQQYILLQVGHRHSTIANDLR